MNLTSYTWNNGTQESPIVLTDAQIEALISAKNIDTLNMNVSGYITRASGKIAKYYKYILNQLYPNLTVIGDEIADTIDVIVSSNYVNEGESITLTAGVTSIPVKYLKAKFTHNINITYGDINEEIVKSRISFDSITGKIIVNSPEENASWTDEITVKLYPIYENEDTENCQEFLLLATATAITSLKLNVPETLQAESKTTLSATPVPEKSTKLIDAKYKYGASAGSILGTVYTAPATTQTVTLTTECYLFGHTTTPDITVTTNVEIYKSVTSTIIINQSGTISYPGSMISGDLGKDATSNANIIHWIHENSKFYIAKWDTVSFAIKIKELSKTDKSLYADGITEAPITTVGNDVFMKLPRFWYYCYERNTGEFLITFTNDENEVNKAEHDWIEWDGKTFIGVYKAYNSGTLMYSVSGVTPSVSFSQSLGKTYAKNRGVNTNEKTGYSLVTYETHLMMAILFYAWYGNTDAQSLCGYGSSIYPKTTGYCNSFGFTDTTKENGGPTANAENLDENGTPMSNNFWGLENWWGDIYEWIDNIKTEDANGLIDILDFNGDTNRQIQVSTSSGYIKQMYMNSQADIIPKTFGGSESTYYTDYGNVDASAAVIARRSRNAAGPYGGVGYLHVGYTASSAGGDVGSRLQYHGDYIEVEDF